jgi:uncharacterized cupredoxin-like copper-binding protein
MRSGSISGRGASRALKLYPRQVDTVLMRLVCIWVAACGLFLALTASGCGSGAAASSHSAVVNVRENDFRIHVRPARIAAGRVRLIVHNRGPADHELILVRAGHARLPLRADGLTVDEEGLERVTVATFEPAAPPAARSVSVRLRKGTYVLFCNMAGHYMGGMRAFLVVS